MNYLILDTNIWIYLANGYVNPKVHDNEQTHSTLLNRLIEKFKSGEIQIVVNDIIIQEWDRNKEAKETLIQRYENLITNNEKHFMSIGTDLGKADRKRLKRLHKHYKDHLKKKIQTNREQIDKLDQILKHEAVKAPITSSNKSKVTDWAIAKKAPLHKNKNSSADALIIFSSIDFLVDKIDNIYNHAIFVSNNTDEFCESKDSSLLHSDLKDEFARIGLELETHLGKALDLSDNIAELIQDNLRQIEEDSVLCQSPFCNGSDYEIYSSVYLSKDIKVKREAKKFDPNQLSFDFEKEYLPQSSKDEFTEYGECVICATGHIVCPDCEEIIPIDDYEEIICRNCENEMELDLSAKTLIIK